MGKSRANRKKTQRATAKAKKTQSKKMQYEKLLTIGEIRTKITECIDANKNESSRGISSIVLFPSSHGSDGVECCDDDASHFESLDRYASIIQNIKDRHYEKNDVDFNQAKDNLIEYIKKNVNLTTAVRPGTCSLMNEPKAIGANVGYDVNYTTSQLDIAIVSRVYDIFTQEFSNTPMTKAIDKFLFELARSQLRTAFVESWGKEQKSAVTKRALNDIKYGGIWKSINLTHVSSDRYYTLGPNENEDLTLDPKYGLHIINATNNIGMHSSQFFDPSQRVIGLGESINFSSNINSDEPSYYNYVVNSPPPQLSLTQRLLSPFTRPDRIIITPDIEYILDNIRTTKTVRLSDLIFMGFLMNIANLTIFDPACRPKTKIRNMKSGPQIVDAPSINYDYYNMTPSQSQSQSQP